MSNIERHTNICQKCHCLYCYSKNNDFYYENGRKSDFASIWCDKCESNCVKTTTNGPQIKIKNDSHTIKIGSSTKTVISEPIIIDGVFNF